MGSILEFRHARISSGALAARSAKSSADKPTRLATGDFKMVFHHSEGIESRCHHLLTAEAEAPVSEAIASFEGHSSITERKDVSLKAMPEFLGQAVLKSKAKLSRDVMSYDGDYSGMTDRMSEAEEKAFFIGRTKAARIARYETQEEICFILGVDQGTYKQYETRSYMPHRFIPKFCVACNVDVNWLLTGDGKGPRREEYIRYVPKLVRRAAKPKRIKAA